MNLFVVFTLKTAAKNYRLNTSLEWSRPPCNLDDIRAMEAHIARDEEVDPVQVTIERADPFYGQTDAEVEL